MNVRLVRRVVLTIAAALGFVALSAQPAHAVGKIYESGCSGTYVLGYQVVGPPIYCPESA